MNESKSFNRSHFFVFSFCIFISFVSLLFSHGVFWDDWILRNKSHEMIFDFIHQLGFFLYWQTHLYDLFNSLSFGVFLNRLICFFAYLVPLFCVNSVLKDVKEISRNERFLVVLFLGIAPLNVGRILLNSIHYALCNAGFFLALWSICKYEIDGKIWRRVLALILFFISFSMNSLLVYYVVPFCFLFYFKKDKGIKQIIFEMSRYLDLILLPIVFWIIKNKYFPFLGYFSQNYNKITTQGLLNGFLEFPKVLKNSFIDLIFDFSFGRMSFFDFVIFIPIGFLVLKTFVFEPKRNLRVPTAIFVVGMLFTFLGSYAYTAVGKISNFANISNTGFQILLPFGVSLMIVGILSWINSYLHLYADFRFQILRKNYYAKDFVLLLAGLLMMSFLKANFDTYVSFNVDWYKHRAMALKMQDYSEFRTNKTIVIDDHTRKYNALGRHTEFYEITGLMREFLKDESRFAFVCYHYPTEWATWPFDPRYFEWFSMKDYVKTEKPDIVAEFKIHDDLAQMFPKLYYYETFYPDKMDEMLKSISSYEFRPLPDDIKKLCSN